jgi:hypothetical protein
MFFYNYHPVSCAGTDGDDDEQRENKQKNFLHGFGLIRKETKKRLEMQILTTLDGSNDSNCSQLI